MSTKHTPGANDELFAAMRRIWRAQVRNATADAVWAGRSFSEFLAIRRAKGGAA